MCKLEIKTISSLEKVLPEAHCECRCIEKGSALKGEEFSYQISYKGKEPIHGIKELQLEIVSDISDFVSVYNIRCVPVLNPMFYDEPDENYILNKPGIMPDVLEKYTDYVMVSSFYFGAVWVSVKVDENICSGKHNIKILFKDGDEIWGESNFELEVIDISLPKLDIPYTNWFHCDCISSYYGVEPLSEKHWELIEKYIKTAAEHGMNMILTPVFTPPLDTKVGLERPTVQLVDVEFTNGVYKFGFDKLSRWLELCRKYDVEYIEVSHLYSQWGAEHAPKIEVMENGKLINKFGWETDSMGDEYKDFISQFIPCLKEYLADNWDEDKIYFHISDEPQEAHIETYGRISEFLTPLLGNMRRMDAMSHYEYIEKGYIETPVVATTAVYDFLDKDIENLWVYYCCGQGKYNLSNRFIGMSSARNRVMGIQLYKYDIKGFLQWGYNFYYSQLSTHLINPYLTTESDGGFPAGDAFSVYPGRDGALPSIRIKVFLQALQDLRALKLLEKHTSREVVMKLTEEVKDFNTYPSEAEYYISLRETVNERLKEMEK